MKFKPKIDTDLRKRRESIPLLLIWELVLHLTLKQFGKCWIELNDDGGTVISERMEGNP